MRGKSKRGTLVGGRWGGRRGAAVIEASFLLPWLFFLFIGAVDAGFELYGLVTVENATRSAALWASQSTTNANGAGSPATACTNYVLPALKLLGNVPSSATCTTGTSLSSLAVTSTHPVALTMTSPTTIPDGTTVSAVTVTVWYLTPQLCPIPGVFSGQTTIKRAVTMRIQQ